MINRITSEKDHFFTLDQSGIVHVCGLLLYSSAKAAAHFSLYVKYLLQKDPSAISNTEILNCHLI